MGLDPPASRLCTKAVPRDTFRMLLGDRNRLFATTLVPWLTSRYRSNVLSKKEFCTTDTVSKISESFGFSTPGYFSKVFKRFTGFTPSDYRKFGYLQESD